MAGAQGWARGIVLALKLDNRDGYAIEIFGRGQTVSLSVSRDGPGRSSSATYLAHGTVTPTSIRASFGARGRVAVRLRPSSRAIQLPGYIRCSRDGEGAIGRRGLFVGGLHFHGEAGYTSVDVHRVSGTSLDLHAFLACLRTASSSGRQAGLPARWLPAGLAPLAATPGAHRAVPPALEVPTHPSPGPKPTTLSADGKLPLARTLFEARARGGGHAHFAAVEERSEGSIAVVRRVQVRASPATFVADDALSLAGVAPPPPFSGTGTWQRTGTGEKSWTGPLAISFLGRRTFRSPARVSKAS